MFEEWDEDTVCEEDEGCIKRPPFMPPSAEPCSTASMFKSASVFGTNSHRGRFAHSSRLTNKFSLEKTPFVNGAFEKLTSFVVFRLEFSEFPYTVDDSQAVLRRR